ncbi:hypothetical protein QRX50_45070 [Amycolatopsis carbonis]|uniref:Uncharacterized protein n=1 Tax=Amycolatopsis carbonis TaxID=715471 RepID=A0A9Y2IG00_9PSEU|nr:hypothetical protein [Amycolatopsis sp. 2-15]WIX78450.1 hypothetical protein QRX50_45070 [Amycolatopsis sp. 2-15]
METVLDLLLIRFGLIAAGLVVLGLVLFAVVVSLRRRGKGHHVTTAARFATRVLDERDTRRGTRRGTRPGLGSRVAREALDRFEDR